MAIDVKKARALRLPPLTIEVERGRVRFFAKAIGETDPVYCDVSAARRAGHPDLLVPPTFFFGLELETPDAFDYLSRLGIDMRLVLHGEQSFTYHAPAHAGDTLTLRSRITDAFSKKGGTMDFLVRHTDITRGADPVAEATTVVIVRYPEGER